MRGRARARDGVLHHRPVVDAEIGQAAGKDRDAGGRAAAERLDRAGDLLGGEDGGHVDLDAVARERAHRVEQRLAALVVTGSLT